MRPLHLLSVAGLIALTSIGIGLNAAQEPDLRPSGKGIGTLDHPPMPDQAKGGPDGAAKVGAAKPTSNGISYHGGPVMTQPTKMYYIWYGNWSNNTATTILPHLAANIGGSPYYNINSTYTNGGGTKVSTAVTYGGATSIIDYRYGSSLSDAQIQSLVLDAINSGALGAANTNGIYFVLTSADVTASSGFCTSYCGWHTYMSTTSGAIKYSFVGDATRCLSACAAQSVSPNGNPGADAMASVIAHELEEAATDPQLNAWYDTRGYENADKCAWTFGTTSTASNGSLTNMKLGPVGDQRDYLIQRNWVNAGGGYCALSY